MTNENCLEGIRCPKCGNEDRFFIVAITLADVTDGGADIAKHTDMEWNDDSHSRCPECGYHAPLKEFRTGHKLPPDPEGMNDKRAAWAGTALAAFMKETGTEDEDALGDLLCDLMHWCDRNNYDFDAALDRARGHYEAETLGEPAA